MAMKHYIDEDGRYLGGWDGIPPEGAIEVGEPPEDARQLWSGIAWSEIPEQVPDSVTKRQAKLALLEAGLIDDVEDLISEMDRGDQIEWSDSVWFSRSSPLISKVGEALSLSQKRLDALFRAAGKM